jgi:hypothetical protein
VGVEEILSVNPFQIYPNPVQNNSPLFLAMKDINSHEITVNVVDIAGRLLSSERIVVNQEGILQITSVSKLVSGSFFVELLWENRKSVEKVVIY